MAKPSKPEQNKFKMAIIYSKRQLIQRIRQHLADDFPSAEFGASESEVLLYIDQALAYSLVGQVYANAKIEGSLVVPEAYYVTYLLAALQFNPVTKAWYTTLPQPPVSLPLGYSIDEAYFGNQLDGKGYNVYWIKAKRRGFRDQMPKPFGVSAWVEGNIINVQANDGTSLLNQPLYVRMASTRTADVDDIMTLPDDIIESIFTNVVTKLKDRMQLPKDIIKDDISAGSKAS